MPRWLQFTIFVTAMIAVYGGSHLYLYRRIARVLGLEPGTRWRRVLRAALFGLALSFPLAMGLNRWHVCWPTQVLYCVAACWMGLYLYLLMFTIDLHLLEWLLRKLALWPRLEALLRVRPDRAGVALVAATSLGLGTYGLIRAAGPLEVSEVEVPMPGLPAELDGTTVVQLTDVHIGAIISSERLERVAREVAALEPDLVVITGDLVDEDADHVVVTEQSLKKLHAPLGVFASTGNHEFYAGVDGAVEHFEHGGIRTLRNEVVALAGGGLLLAGIDDPTGARFDGVEVRFADVLTPQTRDRPMIVLYHQPRHFDEFVALGADLVLAGHTHGGQFWPISWIQKLIYPWEPGLSRVGAGYGYVSRGVGTWGPPMRVGAPPELVRITLRSN